MIAKYSHLTSTCQLISIQFPVKFIRTHGDISVTHTLKARSVPHTDDKSLSPETTHIYCQIWNTFTTHTQCNIYVTTQFCGIKKNRQKCVLCGPLGLWQIPHQLPGWCERVVTLHRELHVSVGGAGSVGSRARVASRVTELG